MKKILLVGSVIFLLVGEISVGLFAQTIRYVRPVEQGTGDGLSWDNASADISAMLAVSGIGDEVWIAAGTYVPGYGTSRYESFVLPSGVKLYGGFAGNEMSLNERDTEINITILSGDIGKEDSLYDNTKHIITIDNNFNNTVDGFKIQNAYCTGNFLVTEPVSISGNYSFLPAAFGATGFYSISGEVQKAEPIDACDTINNLDGKIAFIQRGNCTFVSKVLNAQNAGAIAAIVFDNVEGAIPLMGGTDSNIVIPAVAISLADGEIILNELNAGNTVITRIETGQYGGGIYIGNSNVIINNCTFQENNAKYGSAIYAYNSSLDITNCQFLQNSASYSTIFHYECQVNINHCVFNSNNAENGAALYCSANSATTVKHCLFESNTASYSAGAIYNYLGELAVDSCSFIDNKSHYGGAIRGSGNLALTSINYCYFIDNNVTGGGAGLILSKGMTKLNRCFIFRNIAQNSDSTLGSGGAIQVQDSAQVEITNSVFSDNQAGGKIDDGGGAFIVYSGNLMLNNTTIVNNSTASLGGAIRMYDSNGAVIINNSILWNNTSSEDSADCIYSTNGMLNISYSDIQDENLLAGTGNLNDDPLFVNITNPPGADGIGMTSDDGLMLQTGSPAIGAGSSVTYSLTDILGNPWIDPPSMGAYGGAAVGVNYVPINEDDIYIYPNPATSIINLNGNQDVTNISISNILGQVVWTGNFESFPLNITDWAKGMYIIRCEKEGRYITRKFIKD
jgi:predicted outer membrane repeat protein